MKKTIGEVVKLDRGFPLVSLEDGRRIRCEHSANLVKTGKKRAVIGDLVDVEIPDSHDMGVIESIHGRKSEFIRKDPTERSQPQTLAANFDLVIIVQPITQLNMKRLERELVLAFETKADVAIVLTKTDLAKDDPERAEKTKREVEDLAGNNVCVMTMSTDDTASVEKVKGLVCEGKTAILIGKSGVGKSTLVNILSKKDGRATGKVRQKDGKGRHTTVSREIVEIPGGGRIVDMPGVRGLGLWDAEDGIEATFSDIESLAKGCRFRDCKHGGEPGCAVREAIASGKISESRLKSYTSLMQEVADTADRRRKAKWKN